MISPGKWLAEATGGVVEGYDELVVEVAHRSAVTTSTPYTGDYLRRFYI